MHGINWAVGVEACEKIFIVSNDTDTTLHTLLPFTGLECVLAAAGNESEKKSLCRVEVVIKAHI